MIHNRFSKYFALIAIISFFAIIQQHSGDASEDDYIVVGEDYEDLDFNEDEENEGNAIAQLEEELTETFTTPVDPDEVNSANTTRIVGGRRIAITEAPYQAAILYNRALGCGASVLSALWVLTAAHCVNVGNANNYGVRAGSTQFRTGGQYSAAALIAIHGRYNDRLSLYDIAMVRLRRRFTFSSSLRPVAIPTSSTSRIPSTFVISGWGLTSENAENPVRYLRGTTLNLVSNAQCATAYVGQADTVIVSNMLCAWASGRDSCQGDSGGPLVARGIQWGVVSFGIGCARAAYPGVYTSVRSELPWIYTVARTFRNGVTQRRSLHPKSPAIRLRVKTRRKNTGSLKLRQG